MKISDAIRKAIKEGKYITNPRISQIFGVKFKPTDTPDCMITVNQTGDQSPRWNPTASDLIAEDWVVTE